MTGRRRTLAAVAILAILAGVGAGCGQSGGDARYPKRPEGCEVALYHATPEVPTDNIGPVYSSCTEDVSADDCVRTLKDAVCKLGGDVVWGVAEPTRKDGKVRYEGRAAHTKVRRAKP